MRTGLSLHGRVFFIVSVVLCAVLPAFGQALAGGEIRLSCAGSDDTSSVASVTATAGQRSIVISAGQICAVGDLKISNLRIEPGGLLKSLTSHTVNLTGSFQAGPYQVFANALPGQGRISFENATVGEVLTEWWGANANGATDSTAAFEAAMAALKNNKPGVNGGTIRLLAGNYRTTGLTITDQQVHLIGSGGPGVLGSTATSTTFLSSVTNAPIIKYATSEHLYSFRCRLENLTVVGSVTAGNNQTGVWVDNNGILMNNVGIEKTGSHGLYLTSSSVGGYSNLEISSMKGDGIRIDFSKSAMPGAGTHNNIFHRISIGATGGDGLRIMHGNGNVFFGIDVENSAGDGAGGGAGIHIYYPADGKLEPQNNMIYGAWIENNVVGDVIGEGAQNNYVSYVHYTSPPPKITGNNSYRTAAEFNSPAIDRGSYLLFGASETKVDRLLQPPAAPRANVGRAPGLTGAYTYRVTFETQVGETNGGATSGTINATNQSIQLSGVPLGPPGTVRRNIYRTAAGGSDNTQKFVATLNDNTTTTFDDNTPDSSLGRNVPLYNGSASRIVMDGDGNMVKMATSAQTALVGPQISDPKWPSYGFLSRPGFGMYMENSNELSFVASNASNPQRQLRLLSSGVTDAMEGLSVGSGNVITKYLSAVEPMDFGPWAGSDCQQKTLSVAGAADGDAVALGLPASLAVIDDITWTGFVSSPGKITVRGCKVTPGRTADPPSAKVRASVIQH